jgi:hypothetical protein
MTNRIKVGHVDPLHELIDRTTSALVERGRTALAEGRTVDGEGWTLLDDQLLIQAKPKPHLLDVSDLTAVGVFDKHVCVWRAGEERCTARVSIERANAFVLHHLLDERIAELHRDDADESTETGLGRLLFERWSSAGAIVAALFVAGLGIAVAAVCLVRGLAGANWALVLGGVGALAVAAMLALACLRGRIVFRCYALGISRRSMGREVALRFDALDTFAYGAVPVYVKGSYAFTVYTFAFAAQVGDKLVTIKHKKSQQHPDDEMEGLRETASRAVASRMFARYSAGEPVTWTEHLEFLADGIQYRPSGFLGRKAPIVIPYERIGDFHIEAGKLQLWMVGQAKPVVKESMSQNNLFPGMVMLSSLLQARAAAAAARRAQAAVS